MLPRRKYTAASKNIKKLVITRKISILRVKIQIFIFFAFLNRKIEFGFRFYGLILGFNGGKMIEQDVDISLKVIIVGNGQVGKINTTYKNTYEN